MPAGKSAAAKRGATKKAAAAKPAAAKKAPAKPSAARGATPAKTPAKAKSKPTRRVGEVVKAVRRDLERIRRRDAELAESALAASAIELARELDQPDNSATSKAMCARAMREALDRLDELAPPEEESDRVHDLTSRRAERRGRAAS